MKEPEVERLDRDSALRVCVLMHRVNRLVGVRTPLAEFFTLEPTACYDCRRVLPIAQLCVGPDLFIRCIDIAECRKERGVGAVEEPYSRQAPPPSAAPAITKKPKFKSKGK